MARKKTTSCTKTGSRKKFGKYTFTKKGNGNKTEMKKKADAARKKGSKARVVPSPCGKYDLYTAK